MDLYGVLRRWFSARYISQYASTIAKLVTLRLAQTVTEFLTFQLPDHCRRYKYHTCAERRFSGWLTYTAWEKCIATSKVPTYCSPKLATSSWRTSACPLRLQQLLIKGKALSALLIGWPPRYVLPSRSPSSNARGKSAFRRLAGRGCGKERRLQSAL